MKISIEEKQKLDAGFLAQFQSEPNRYFSAPGRTEIGGNHTDHQRGCVLAAAVNLDTVAAVKENGTDIIRIQSEGYPICFASLAVLQYLWRLRPFVSLCCGDSILTNSIAFFYSFQVL